MIETAAYLDYGYECGSPSYLPFYYKMKHKDKISKCACGDDVLSGICLNKARSKTRGIASTCSSSSSSPSFSFSPNCFSNVRSSWRTKGEAPFTDSNSDPVSNSNSDSSSNSGPSSSSNCTSNSNPTSNSSFTSNSNPSSVSSFTSNSSHTSSFNTNKIDLTNKVCNGCGVVKQITSFDKKKARCKECSSTKVKCVYCSSIFSFCEIKGHIKKLIEK